MNRRRQTRVEKVMQHFARSSQTAPIVGAQSSDHLNLIRGLAAIAVLLAHIRWRLFVDPYDIAHLNPLQAAFYAITIFGRDAVMVFAGHPQKQTRFASRRTSDGRKIEISRQRRTIATHAGQ